MDRQLSASCAPPSGVCPLKRNLIGTNWLRFARLHAKHIMMLSQLNDTTNVQHHQWLFYLKEALIVQLGCALPCCMPMPPCFPFQPTRPILAWAHYKSHFTMLLANHMMVLSQLGTNRHGQITDPLLLAIAAYTCAAENAVPACPPSWHSRGYCAWQGHYSMEPQLWASLQAQDHST